ncbi:MAG TPA: sigma-70 family RNA polymerase sigma factor [Jatrophihabitantaceae bacterium]
MSPPTGHRCARGCAQLCTDDGLAAAYAEHAGRLLARAQRVVIDPHLAEEAVQEAFTRAWRACASFDPCGGPLVNWLLAITGNIAVDLVRSRRRRPQVQADEPHAAAATTTGGVDAIVLRAQLRGALAGISKLHRDAVVETILFDRPYAEVAAEFGIKPATLRTRVHYALRSLRIHLESADLTP